MSGASGRTLGGVQRKAFVPNVNARRNKKQSTDDPLAKLLHADTAEPVLPTLPTAASRSTAAVPKRSSPRLTGQGSPRPKPVAAPSPKVSASTAFVLRLGAVGSRYVENLDKHLQRFMYS